MKNTIKIKCKKCDNIIDVDLEDYDLSWEVADSYDHGENGMGEEIHHEAIVDVECPNCNTDGITISLNVWEYPIGAYNDQQIDVDGAELIEGCDIQCLAPIGDVEED